MVEIPDPGDWDMVVFDVDGTLASMEKIESFVTEIGATFWIEHDYELFQELKKAPMYYE